MTSYVLDTDTLSLLQRGNSAVGAQLSQYDADEVATTIVSVEEQLSGWYTLLRRAKTATELVPIYQRMSDTIRFLSALPILPFTDTAARTYDQLRRDWPRRGRMDLRIAAIAMAFDAVLVTRNRSDFDAIDELNIMDWSTGES